MPIIDETIKVTISFALNGIINRKKQLLIKARRKTQNPTPIKYSHALTFDIISILSVFFSFSSETILDINIIGTITVFIVINDGKMKSSSTSDTISLNIKC